MSKNHDYAMAARAKIKKIFRREFPQESWKVENGEITVYEMKGALRVRYKLPWDATAKNIIEAAGETLDVPTLNGNVSSDRGGGGEDGGGEREFTWLISHYKDDDEKEKELGE